MVGSSEDPQGVSCKFWAGWAVCTHCDLDGLMGGWLVSWLSWKGEKSSSYTKHPTEMPASLHLRNKNHAPESRPTLTNQTKNQMDSIPPKEPDPVVSPPSAGGCGLSLTRCEPSLHMEQRIRQNPAAICDKALSKKGIEGNFLHLIKNKFTKI